MRQVDASSRVTRRPRRRGSARNALEPLIECPRVRGVATFGENLGLFDPIVPCNPPVGAKQAIETADVVARPAGDLGVTRDTLGVQLTLEFQTDAADPLQVVPIRRDGRTDRRCRRKSLFRNGGGLSCGRTAGESRAFFNARLRVLCRAWACSIAGGGGGSRCGSKGITRHATTRRRNRGRQRRRAQTPFAGIGRFIARRENLRLFDPIFLLDPPRLEVECGCCPLDVRLDPFCDL